MFDELDNIIQLIFATSKSAFSVARRDTEIERAISDRVSREAFFQKPMFVGRQDKIEVPNSSGHPINLLSNSPRKSVQ